MALEVAASFLFLHASSAFVLVDDATLAFTGLGQQHFLNDLRQRRRVGFHTPLSG